MLFYGNNVTFQYVGYESVTRPGKTNRIKKKMLSPNSIYPLPCDGALSGFFHLFISTISNKYNTNVIVLTN